MEQKSKIWYLENFNFFSELNQEERNYVCQNTKMKSVEKNEAVYFQQGSADRVYFLKEGKIRISKFNPEGEEFLVAFLEPGEIFGEASITGNRVRNEAAIAEEAVVFCVMRKERMKKLLLMSPALNFKFSQMIEARLEKTQKRLEDLSFKNNQERIIDFLKETALISSQKSDGALIINNSLTHEKIAQLTSTNRQEVSAVFSSLKKKQIIDYNRKEIRILKLNELHT